MKKLFMFLAVAGLATFGASCSSDDGGNGGGGSTEKQLVAKASPSTVEVNKAVTFSATSDGKAVDGVKFYEGSTELKNPHTFTTKGEYKVVAKKEGFKESVAITVKVNEPGVVEPKKLTLILSSDAVDLGEAVSFTVMEGTNDVSTTAEIFVNGKKVANAPYTADKEGEYSVVAKKAGAIDSDAQIFTVTKPIEIPAGGSVALGDVVKPANNAKIRAYHNGEAFLTNKMQDGTIVTIWEYIVFDDTNSVVSSALFGIPVNDNNVVLPSEASNVFLFDVNGKIDGKTITVDDLASFEAIAFPQLDIVEFGDAAYAMKYISVFKLKDGKSFGTSFNGAYEFELYNPPAPAAKGVSFKAIAKISK